MDQLLTVQEAAKLLACSEAAIRKWIYQRRLPALKVGRLVRVSVVDLEKFVANTALDKRSDEQ
jgi:excisionase family DNA binding protein